MAMSDGRRPHSLSESHGQTLEQKRRFPDVFYDDGDSPVNLVYQLYGHAMSLSQWQLDRKYGCWSASCICPPCSVLPYSLLHLAWKLYGTQRMCLLPAGSARREALPVFRLLTGRFLGFFVPQGRHVAPIKVKFGREELPAKFDLDRFSDGGLRPSKLKKIGILPI